MPRHPAPAPDDDTFAKIYVALRLAAINLEKELGAENNSLSEDDLKRLDKAVTVMKVGFKIMKKVLAKRGHHQLKKVALRAV